MKIYLILTLYVWFVIINGAANEIINPMKDPHICGRPICDVENQKFRFNKATAYKYEYSSHFKTLFDGTDETASEYFVYGVAEVHFPSQCQGVLKLSEIKLRDTPVVEEDSNEAEENDYYDYNEQSSLHPKSAKFSEDLEAHELRFAFHDGLIQEVCPDASEPVWVINMKRGILSSFQNTMTRFDIDHNATETDVSGKCDVSYKLLGSSGTNLLIQKDKDISTCKNRYRYNSIVQKTSYEFRKNYVEWWPILESKSFCNITIDHYVFNTVECHEHNIFIPLSNNQNGAATKSVIKLKLVDEYESHAFSDDSDLNSIEKRQSLLYDHSHSPKPTHGEIKASREYLKKMCQLGFPNIQREFPDIFIKFLAASKQLTLPVLQQLLARARSICPNGKKHVLESLPFIGSSASVILMKNLIIEKSITDEMIHAWMHSIFYLPYPDDDVIDAMFSLIEHYETTQDPMFVLIPTSVVHTFCVNNEDCQQRNSVMRIIKYLEENVAKYLESDLSYKKNFEALIVSMKGLGNIGKTSKIFENNLRNLITDPTILTDTRLQAIGIFRRLNCEKSRDFFIDMYKNATENVEVRIASYLQAMKCPDYISIKTIKTILKEERINQVGSFVWSHLHNLAKSASPTQVELQALLADNKLDDRFNMDIRKFSRNYEYSLFFDEYNFGVTADSNLIFDTNSYMPRSLFFNGTVNMFGESINALEFNVRMLGFEHYVESIFGPKGPLNYDKISNIMSTIMQYVKKSLNLNEDYILERLIGRGKREVSSKISHELNNIKKLPYKLNYDHNHPHGYLEYKVFGNDINIFMFDGYEDFDKKLKSFIAFDSIRGILSGKEEVFAKSGTLLDISYTVPLCSGVPLSLSAFGASSLDLRYSASLKNSNVFESKSLEFHGKLKPSLSMEFTGKMQADLFYASTEIKVKNNLYSNYAIEGDLKINGTNHMALKIKLPQERNEIFSIRTKLGVNKNGKDYSISGISSRYDNTTCTWPSIDNSLGLKMCVDYSVPDVSDPEKEFPSLIMSGPIKFDIHLDKTDPTAKLFNFEYTWTKNDSVSQGLFTFETPGSEIPRVFVTNVTSKEDGYNVQMGFQNGNTTHSALGLYKNTRNEKRMDLSLSIDGQKQFSLEMGLNRTDVRHGGVFYPLFLLTISNQQVAGMTGTIRLTEKKNISQYDINLQFETKKMQSTLNGYIIKTEASTNSKLTLNYKFSGTDSETIELETSISNRSQRMKGKYEYEGAMKFMSTAYSYLNFASKYKFISAMGHMECIVDVNNAPDLEDPAYTLSTKLMFARSNEKRDTRTTASIEVVRPKSMTDYKFYIKHEERYKNGSEHDVFMVIRYAPKKEMTGTASVLIPRSVLFAVDSAFNLTIPDMGSLTAAVKIKERVRNEYILDLKGEWFTGQTIQLKGIYQDKTSNVKKFYHLKMNIQSKSFDDVNLLLKYSHDHYEFKFDIHTELMGKVYAFKLKNSDLSPTESKILIELKWKEQVYSLSSHSLSDTIKKTTIELHLDKIRDIYIQVWGQSDDAHKQLGVELKWDANRDPSQKVIFSCAYNKPETYAYNGNFLVSYPERSLSGQFDISNGMPDYRGNFRVSWSTTDAIIMSYSVGSEMSDSKRFWIKMKANTPFEGWKQNSFEGSIFNENNNYVLNSTAMWADSQLVGIELKFDYLLTEKTIFCEFKSDLKSSVQDIPAIATYFKHSQSNDKIDTEISVKHKKSEIEDDRLFYVKSKWEFGATDFHKNVSGSVQLRSPFEGYTSGILFTKFTISNNRHLKGLIDVDIENRNYALTVEGYLKKLTENMLSINISTPIETFKYINGRFGINEKERHIVADIKTPTKALGAEVLFGFNSVTDFNIKFYLATPVEPFERFLLIGKLNDNEVHFEGGWNNLTLGFIGVWRFLNYRDFEYSYQVLTSLEKYERNGVIARVIYQNRQNFDVEFSFKLSHFKLGVKFFGEPKGELSKEATHLKDDFMTQLDDSTEDYEDDFDDDANLFNLIGNFEIDTFFWKTIKGDLDIEEFGSKFHCFGNIYIPQGKIQLRNVLNMPHYFYIINRLELLTPFPNYEKIESVYKFLLEPPESYNVGFEVSLFNQTHSRDYGFKVKYINITDEDDEEIKTHNLTLTLITPIPNSKFVVLNTVVELEAGSFKGNLSVSGLATKLQLFGLLKKENNFFDTSFGMFLSSPVVPRYFCQIFSKRKFSDEKNLFQVGFNLNENFVESNFLTEITWAEPDNKSLDASVLVTNDILPIKVLNSSLIVKKGSNPKLQLYIFYSDLNAVSDEMKVLIMKQNLSFRGEVRLPHPDYRNISFTGTLVETTRPGAYQVNGHLFRQNSAYDFEGTAFFLKNMPINVEVTIDSNPKTEFAYRLTKEEFKTSLNAKLTQQKEFFELDVDTYVKNKLDWAYNVKTSSSKPEITDMKLSTHTSPISKESFESGIEMISPWESYGIGHVNLSSIILITQNNGDINLTYHLWKYMGNSSFIWKWVLFEDMKFKILTFRSADSIDKTFKTGLKYVKSLNNLLIEGDMDINSIWKLSAFGDFNVESLKDVEFKCGAKLPAPIDSNHLLNGKLKANIGPKQKLDVSYQLQYKNENEKSKIESQGHYKNDTNLNGKFKLEWGLESSPSTLESLVALNRNGQKKDLKVDITTPFYPNEKSLILTGNYDQEHIYHMISANINIPESKQFATSNVAYSDLSNMKGKVNCTLPMLNITWFHVDFDFETPENENVKYIKASWPNNHAILDSKSTLVIKGQQTDWQGTIKAEIPLQTSHQAQIIYGLSARPKVTNGHATVEYNKQNVLTSTYTCKTENTDRASKKVIDLSLQNNFKPIGVHYSHINEFSKTNENLDIKHGEVFDLQKKDRFNITGELKTKTRDNGHNYEFIAIHPNRTIKITTNYKSEGDNTNHKAKIELAPTVWLGCDLDVKNLTQFDNDTQKFKVLLSYPSRNLTAKGFYSLTDNSFDSDVSLEWTKKQDDEDKQPVQTQNKNDDEDDYENSYDDPVSEPEPEPPKIMRAGLHWKAHDLQGNDINNQTVVFVIKHPTFEKDISLKGSYYRSTVDILKTQLMLEYADDPYHLVKFDALVKNLTSEVGYKNFSLTINGVHEVSDLDLKFEGSIGLRPKLYEMISWGHYKRSYLSLQELDMSGFLNIDDKKFKLYRSTPNKVIHLYGDTTGSFPIYEAHAIYEDTPEIESSALFQIDIGEKLLNAQVNLTSDASQNLQVYGEIPDSRSASFAIWRNYEEIQIRDVSYFLKMNHSRLISSRLTWRPKMRNEVNDKIKEFLAERYNAVSDEIDYWVKTIYTESTDTVNDIWVDAQDYTRGFREDLSGLQDIEEDIIKLRTFLNESYNADDFYVQSFVNFTMAILDEMAIKDHIESIPKIIREMWQALGESGQALRKSILWLIETFKSSYKASLDVISQLLHGKSFEYLSKFMETLVEKYDKFIKNLHLSFIKYVERVWTNLVNTITNYWNKMLKNIEPVAIRFIHYMDTVVTKVCKELFDFLYERTNEIMESPYFHQVSDLTQDLDRLYQDLMTNDIFTNIKKYTTFTYRFLKEKIFNILPFGKEIQEIFSELMMEMKALQKIESVQYAMKRWEEIQTKVIWLANEFQIEKRLNSLAYIIKKKLTKITQNALETDDKYREAKTKFIFDPDVGVIEWEQKLPMSWHAFNDTPKLEEIPEYRMLNDLQAFFTEKRNTTVWSFYYELKPYLELRNYLPPFKAHALLVGSQHFITFDNSFVSIPNECYQETDRSANLMSQCSYLLAHDYVNGDFSLILKPSIIEKSSKIFLTKKLLLLTDEKTIEIDNGNANEKIKIGNNPTTSLPLAFGDVLIHLDANIVTIESRKGFILECNLDFDVCSFEVSGWYFGKLAGILGTMNNEVYDDFATSDHQLTTSGNALIDSWKLSDCPKISVDTKYSQFSEDVISLCDSFFKRKTSYFTTCFDKIDPFAFYQMCLSLTTSQMYKISEKEIQKGACTAAIAYIEACDSIKIPLRVPDSCIHCDLTNGSFIPEGTFITLENEYLQHSADVVFIVESKDCNKDIIKNKNLMGLVRSLNKELTEHNLKNNLFSLIAFGGNLPFTKPRPVTVQGEVFAKADNFEPYFQHLSVMESGQNNDIFEAIIVASKLIFRPGTSKVFVLIPCSNCSADETRFDYSSVIQLLAEHNIKLHILMDHEFLLDKPRIVKEYYGIDRDKVYTRKDLKTFKGDEDVRSQIRVPKSNLGHCIPLAYESDGSIFSTRRMDKKNFGKKFHSVFAKRIAETAKLTSCQTCECSGHNTGVAYMVCLPCSYQSFGINYDDDFDDDTFDDDFDSIEDHD